MLSASNTFNAAYASFAAYSNCCDVNDGMAQFDVVIRFDLWNF